MAVSPTSEGFHPVEIKIGYPAFCLTLFNQTDLKMINQVELKGFLQKTLPEFSKKWSAEEIKNPYAAMQILLQLTTEKAQEHDFRMVKRCLETAGRLHDHGNSIIKNAVENIYVYSLSNLLYAFGEDKPRLLAIIPMTLYTVYINQIKSGGC